MVVSLVIAPVLLGAWSPTFASAAQRTSHPVSVPRGWKTYTYGKARISVPGTWAVEHEDDCPVRSAPGTLSLGIPAAPSVCAALLGAADTVRLVPLSAPNPFVSLCPTIRVHGLSVKVGPCGSSNAAGVVIYWVPALGVQAEGTGSADENVTGPATGTVVGRVLHTLRR